MVFRTYWEGGADWETCKHATDFAHIHVVLVGEQVEGTVVQSGIRREAKLNEHLGFKWAEIIPKQTYVYFLTLGLSTTQ